MYLFIYFTSLHVSSNPVLIIRRIELYQYVIWYRSLCVGRLPGIPVNLRHVRTSLHLYQRGSFWPYFRKIWYLKLL